MKENIRKFVDAHKGELISIGVVAGLTGLAFVGVDIRSKLNMPKPPKMSSVTFDELEKHFPEVYKQCLEIGHKVFDNGPIDPKHMIGIGYIGETMVAEIL